MLLNLSCIVTTGGGLKATAINASCGVEVGTWLIVIAVGTPKSAEIPSTAAGV